MARARAKVRRLGWRVFNNAYGGWHELVETVDSMPKSLKGASVQVIPDMEPGRWFWSVKIGPAKDRRTVGHGAKPTLEEAQRAALEVFDRHRAAEAE